MGFLFVAASLVVEHGALGRVSSVAVAPRSRALAQYLRHTGLAVPPQVGSFQTRNRTRVSCIDRQIVHYWATKEVPLSLFIVIDWVPWEKQRWRDCSLCPNGAYNTTGETKHIHIHIPGMCCQLWLSTKRIGDQSMACRGVNLHPGVPATAQCTRHESGCREATAKNDFCI